MMKFFTKGKKSNETSSDVPTNWVIPTNPAARFEWMSGLGGQDNEGCTVLHRYAEAGNAAGINSLFAGFTPEQTHAALSLENDKAATPLHAAAGNGHANAVRALLEKVPRQEERTFIVKTNNNGVTPVHAAARNGHREALKALVESIPWGARGQYVNQQTDKGMNALHLAINNEHFLLAHDLLQECQADPAPHEGVKLITLAKKKGAPQPLLEAIEGGERVYGRNCSREEEMRRWQEEQGNSSSSWVSRTQSTSSSEHMSKGK